MWPRPRRSASARATSSRPGERSPATTDPGRRASGSARRPGPHPYSSVDIGANCGARPASITLSIHATSDSPVAKKIRSCSGVRLARRDRGSVTTEKYGSRAAKASNLEPRTSNPSWLFDTDAVHPQREMASIAAAVAAGDEEIRRLDRDLAAGRFEEIRRNGERLLEVGGGIEGADLASADRHAHVRRRVELPQGVLAGETERQRPSGRTDPQVGALARPAPRAPFGAVELRLVPAAVVREHRDSRRLGIELLERQFPDRGDVELLVGRAIGERPRRKRHDAREESRRHREGLD